MKHRIEAVLNYLPLVTKQPSTDGVSVWFIKPAGKKKNIINLILECEFERFGCFCLFDYVSVCVIASILFRVLLFEVKLFYDVLWVAAFYRTITKLLFSQVLVTGVDYFSFLFGLLSCIFVVFVMLHLRNIFLYCRKYSDEAYSFFL